MQERKVYLVKLEDGSSRVYDYRSRIADISNRRVHSIEEIVIGEPLTSEHVSNTYYWQKLWWVGVITLFGAASYMLFSGNNSKTVRANEMTSNTCTTLTQPIKREMCYKGFVKLRKITRLEIPTDHEINLVNMESMPNQRIYADEDTLLVVD